MVPTCVAELISMRFKEGLYDSLIRLLLNVFYGGNVISVAGDQNSGIVIVVKSQRQKICNDRRIDSFFDGAFQWLLTRRAVSDFGLASFFFAVDCFARLS